MSLQRASSIFICQSTPRWVLLTWVGPSRRFRTQDFDIAKASATNALAGKRTQFIFGDVEPTVMLGRMPKLDAANQLMRPFWLKGFVKCPFRISVEMVAHQNNLFALCLATFEPSQLLNQL